jgi:hypothetical protein
MSAVRMLQDGKISRRDWTPRLCVEVSVDTHTTHNFWSGLGEGTIGGVFVATHNAVLPGSLVSLHLVMGGAHWDVIEAIAEVRRVIPYREGHVDAGIVLAFVDVDLAAMSRIRRFVATVRDPLFFED